MDIYEPTPREQLENRVKRVLEERGTDPSHHQWYLDNLTEAACQQVDNITDEHINNSIAARELFWGLGTALMRYAAWEQEQGRH
jgi:hypothetical protein